MRKQVVIDLCKVVYCGWFALTALLIFASYDSYVSTPYFVEDNTHVQCSNGMQFADGFCNSKNELVIESWCSKGLFDKTPYCLSDSSNDNFYMFHSDLGELWSPLIIINGLNGIALFVILNRKYKPFAFKTCSGNILNERQNLGSENHE